MAGNGKDRYVLVSTLKRAGGLLYRALACLASTGAAEVVLRVCEEGAALRPGSREWYLVSRLLDCGLAYFTVRGGLAPSPAACAAARLAAGRYARDPARLLRDLGLVDDTVAEWARRAAERAGPLERPAQSLMLQREVSAGVLARIILWSQERLLEAVEKGDYEEAARALAAALPAPVYRGRLRWLARLIAELAATSRPGEAPRARS